MIRCILGAVDWVLRSLAAKSAPEERPRANERVPRTTSVSFRVEGSVALSESKLAALIADDDEYFRMAIKAILKDSLGFHQVIETGSFDEAVEQLEGRGRVALAIFDLSMPGIDSPAALREIRDNFQVDKLAVISASQSRGDMLGSLDAGAHGFVWKGQGVTNLKNALQQIIDGEIYVPSGLADLPSGSITGSGSTPAARPSPSVPQITPRQRDVLEMLVDGAPNKTIARSLNLGQGTIKVHLAALFRKLGVSNRAAAAAAGARLLPHLPARQEQEKPGS